MLLNVVLSANTEDELPSSEAMVVIVTGEDGIGIPVDPGSLGTTVELPSSFVVSRLVEDSASVDTLTGTSVTEKPSVELDGCEIFLSATSNCVVGSCSLVTEGTVIPESETLVEDSVTIALTVELDGVEALTSTSPDEVSCCSVL